MDRDSEITRSSFSEGHDVSLDAIRALLSRCPETEFIAKQATARVAIQRSPKGKGWSHTWMVRTREMGDFVLKVHDCERRYIEKEECAIAMLQRHSACSAIRLPEVISACYDAVPAFILFRRLWGCPIDRRSHKSDEVINKTLAQACLYRNLTFSSFGEIAGQYHVAQNKSNLMDYTQQLVDFWVQTIGTHVGLVRVPRLRVVLGRQPVLASLLTQHPCLCHSDLTPHNLLYHDGNIVIVDYDNAFAYVPEFDICKILASFAVQEWDVDVSKFCHWVARWYGETCDYVEEGVHRFYWIVVLRLMSWNASHMRYPECEKLDHSLSMVYR